MYMMMRNLILETRFQRTGCLATDGLQDRRCPSARSSHDPGAMRRLVSLGLREAEIAKERRIGSRTLCGSRDRFLRFNADFCENHRMTAQTSTQKRRAVSPVLIGFVGMIIVPVCIVLAANSWDAPDAADYVRMAFGTVIASTLAMLAAWWLALNRVKAGGSDRYWSWGVAVVFTFFSIGGITNAARTLLTQLTNL